MHNVLDPLDWVPDELAQLRTSGYDTDRFAGRVAEALSRASRDDMLAVRADLQSASRIPGWQYDEPDSEASLLALIASVPSGRQQWSGDDDDLYRRLHGAWLGRCIGCCMGKPVEGLTKREVELYARAAGDFPISTYLPLIDPLPDGVSHLHESAGYSAAGLFDAMPRDDDIDWTILGLSMLETHGEHLGTTDIATAWLDSLPFTQTFTAERAAYRNLLHGLVPPTTATHDNPYREWIGALIRADIFGYVHPGHPAAAARLAVIDARLSHVGNGVYGEMWAAALVAAAFTATDMLEAVTSATAFVPPGSRLHAALRKTVGLFEAGMPWDDAMLAIESEVGHYDWVHTINNAAHIAAALLWGGGDFVKTISLVVHLGCDTDSAGATAGSVFGAMYGVDAIPGRLAEPLNDCVRSAIRGFDRTTISQLVDRTHALATSAGGERI